MTATVAKVTSIIQSSTSLDKVRNAYAHDENLMHLMNHLSYSSRQTLNIFSAVYPCSSDLYTLRNGLLYYAAAAGVTARFGVLKHNSMRLRITYECQKAPFSGRRGRKENYLTASRNFTDAAII